MNNNIDMKKTSPVSTRERAHCQKGNEYLMQESIKRYNFAKEYCKNKKILDIGSGEGYGDNIISESAGLVVGIDNSLETVKHSKYKYRKKNLYFVGADCDNLPFHNSYFDVVISYEVIEHLSSPCAYLSEITRIISKSGIYIGSTPQVYNEDADSNPFHKHPYSKEEYKDLLSKYFSTVIILGEKNIRKISKLHAVLRHLDFLNLRNKIKAQFLRKFLARMFGSTPFEEVTQEDFIINSEGMEYAPTLISICHNNKRQN